MKDGNPTNPYNPNIWLNGTPTLPSTNDGLSDIATFYDYGSCTTRIHAFLSTGSSFAYQGSGGWWASNSGSFCASSIKAATAGDFNNDGKDDIAAFYDYGSGGTGIWVFLNSGDSFTPYYWWTADPSFSASSIKYVVSGNFGTDNYDDIAVFYGSGSDTTVYVFAATGSNFIRYSWWSSSGYSLSSTYGAASGDFDYDGDDDVAVVYDYGSDNTRIHVFLATGSYFYYPSNYGWWQGSGYRASLVKHALSEKYNGGGLEDLALFYDNPGSSVTIHAFLSTGSSFTYQGDGGWWSVSSGYDLNLVPFALTGQYNTAGTVRDITTIFNYPGSETRFHEFLGTASSFSYQGASGWWSATGYNTTNIKQAVTGAFGAP